MSETLKAIKEKNMIFISAQPDEVYFHWQVEIYLYQFSKLGILDHCHAVFGHKTDKPSDYAMGISKKFPGRVFFYKDERTPEQTNYIPTIRPHILKKFFKQFPNKGKNVFYHDSDIFIVKLPPFEKMLKWDKDNTGYLSDTVSYIGASYIIECSKRYQAVYPDIPDNDLFKKMVNLFPVSEELVISNQENSGGAQYLLKNIGSKFWEDVEIGCIKMWKVMKDYEKQYPIKDHIQSWTTDMWAVLWTYWGRGKKTVVDKTLDFSWGVSSVQEYHNNNIFHLAGVTSNMRNKHFYKGDFSGKNVFTEYQKNNQLFSNVSKDSATFEYISVIKEYVNNNLDKPKFRIVNKFKLIASDSWAGVYRKVPKQLCGKNLWRSANNSHLIFYNGGSWVITSAEYESEIKEGSGGYVNNGASEPYEGNWNLSSKIKIF